MMKILTENKMNQLPSMRILHFFQKTLEQIYKCVHMFKSYYTSLRKNYHVVKNI
jgi:hypothetical protein